MKTLNPRLQTQSTHLNEKIRVSPIALGASKSLAAMKPTAADRHLDQNRLQ
ncbi:hypothetical protein [Microcoleus sp. PH2017_05_CCC_O_A]|uniref:hypothetical protein n=1 Tax=Microcoleus sp. PH2017_05_CCC_O_A TaxID=2798816 RepID=UPI0025EF0D61|nr:hypothetical protein [Microcoleus sp. PH2017_05_CCC_O_A]